MLDNPIREEITDMPQRELEYLLRTEFSLMTDFVSVLEQEHVLLKSPTSVALDGLPGLTDRKQALASQLLAVVDQRGQLLISMGLEPDGAGLRNWGNQTQDAHILSLLDQLRALGDSAKHLNESNSRLVNLRLQVTQQALSVLMPQDGVSSLYQANGIQSLTPGSAQKLRGSA